MGVNTAKGLALGRGLPLIGINHLEAHLYAVWLTEAVGELSFPLLGLIVSGGHTELVLMQDHGIYRHLGGTIDDAAGEAFDKVGRLLELSYPGGPSIQKAAQDGDPTAFTFPRAWLDNSYNFSFSGLKTAVLRQVQRLERDKRPLPVADMAASFQAAAVEVLVAKTVRAAAEFEATAIALVGGVSRQPPAARDPGSPCRPAGPHATHRPLHGQRRHDAACGYWRFQAGQRDGWEMDVVPSLPLV